MNRAFISATLATVASAFLFAAPIPKTPVETEVTIAGQTIVVKYQAVSANGREVFGSPKALLQPNTVWRAGAGTPTTLFTNAPLDIGGLQVPAGQYTLFVELAPQGWQLIVNKATGAAANIYRKQQDLGRVPMTTSHSSQPVDPMKFTVSKSAANDGVLQLAWADVAASVNFAVK